MALNANTSFYTTNFFDWQVDNVQGQHVACN